MATGPVRPVASIATLARALVLGLLIAVGASAVAQAATTFYVSPAGRDGNPGTKARPFRTLYRARDAARKVPRPLRADVVIKLRGGTYRLSRPLKLRARDSGGNGHDVVYEAAPGARPLISGGRRITGWKLFDRSRGIYRARAPKLRTRQLYVDGRRAPRAQSTVNPSGFTKTATGYRTTDAAMARWRNPGDIEVLYNWRWKSFRCPVASIDGDQITMVPPCWHNANVFAGPASIGLPTRVENAYELLDQPREWYLDRHAGWIYYKPARGEKLAGEDVEAAARQVLVDGRGTLARPVSHVRFDHLRFGYATWMGVSGREGYADDQTGFHVTGADQPQTLEHAQFTTRTPGNLRFAYARFITIADSTFRHMGAVAVDFDTGSQHDTIEGSRFGDISAAAVQLGGVDAIASHPSQPGQVTRDNLIAGNTVTRAAREFFDAAAIFVGYTTRTTISHNTLSNLPYSGIAIGWGWGMTDPGQFPGCTGCPFQHWKIYKTPTASQGNRIVANKVSNYLKRLYDGGGIYSLGQQGTSLRNGEVIARNVVFGKAPSHGGNALYTDGGSRYITLRRNVLFNNPHRGRRAGRQPLRPRLGRLPPLRRHRLGPQLVAEPGEELRLLPAVSPGPRLPQEQPGHPGPIRRARRDPGPRRRPLTGGRWSQPSSNRRPGAPDVREGCPALRRGEGGVGLIPVSYSSGLGSVS